jgi:GGDEF domain-containing protein
MTSIATPFPALSVAILGDAGPWQAACARQAWSARHGEATDAGLLTAAEEGADVLLWAAPEPQALWGLKSSAALAAVAADTTVVLLVPAIADALLLQLVRLGVEDVLVLPPLDAGDDVGDEALASAQSAALTRAVQVAVARKRISVLQRKGGSIDLATGLPTRAQWLDHLSQLCALRERERAPMAVVVLRTEGSALIEQRFGAEALALVHRKLAVRLRAALRASDVVGAVSPEAYAVLLTWMESDTDADLVAGKLRRSLEERVRVGTDHVAVAVCTGIAHYGADGKDGPTLLRAALARAGSATEGDRLRPGRPQPVGRVGGAGAAANDADHDPDR